MAQSRPNTSECMPSTSLRRKIIFCLWQYFLLLASTLLLSEVILRLSGRVTIEGVHTASEEDFHRIPGVFEPRQDVIERPRPELTHHVSINSLGFRGPEMSRTKPPGVVRILCLGDSFTYGSYVNDEETFPFYLQTMFLQKQTPVEVINGGVGGTTIVDQIYFLKKSIEIAPDVVLLTFTENDVDDIGKTEPMYISLENNRKIKSGTITYPVFRLVRDTALFNVFLLLKATYAQQIGVQGKKGPVGASSENDRQSIWGRYEDFLKEMKIYLSDRSVQFVFAIFPSHYRIGGTSEIDIRSPDRLERIENVAQANGVPTVNLLPTIKRANLPVNQLYLLPYDGHPSKVAYSMAAKTIFEHLEGKVRQILMVKSVTTIMAQPIDVGTLFSLAPQR